MADSRQLLVKFRADLRSLKADFSEVQRSVQSLNKSLMSEKDKAKVHAAADLRAAIDGEKQKQAVAQTTIKLEQTKQAVNKTEQVEAQKILAIKRQETLEIQRQVAEIRLKAEAEKAASVASINAIRRQQAEMRLQQQQAARQGSPGGGIVANLAGSMSRLAGGGVAGGILGGMLLGGGVIGAVTILADGFTHLAEKLKAFILESGPLQQLNNQFEQLAKNAGISAPEFMERLRKSTRGLVEETTLLRIANASMRSSMKLSETDTIRFTTNVTELARSLGKSVPQAMAAAQRSLTTGQPMMISRFLELPRRELRPQRVPGQTIIEQERASFEQVNRVIESRRAMAGNAPETFTEKLTQLQVAQKGVFEQFGQGVATSSGMVMFMELLGKIADKFGGLTGIAHNAGQAVGGFLGVLSHGIPPILTSLQSLANIISKGLSLDKLFKPYSWKDDMEFFHKKLAADALDLTRVSALLTLSMEASAPLGRGPQEAWLHYKQTMATAEGDYQRSLTDYTAQANKPGSELGGEKPKAGEGGPLDPAIRQEKLKEAQEDVKISKSAEQQKLTDAEQALDDRRDALKRMLKSGQVDEEEYVKRSKILNEEDRQDKLRRMTADLDAQKKDYDLQLKYQQITAPLHAKKLVEINQDRGTQTSAINRQVNKQNLALDDELAANHQTSVERRINDEAKAQKDALDLQQSETKDAYDKMLLPVETYIAAQKRFADQEYEIAVDKAGKIYDVSDRGEKELEQLMGDEVAAYDAHEKRIVGIVQTSAQERISYYQREAQQRLGYIQGLTARDVSTRGGRPLSAARQAEDLTSEIKVTQEEIVHLNSLLEDNGGIVKKLSSEWYSINDAITKATESLNAMQQQLGQIQSPVDSIFGALGTIGAGLSGIGRGSLRGLGGLPSLYNTLFGHQITVGPTNVPTTPTSPGTTLPGFTTSSGPIGDAFSGVIDAFKTLVTHTGSVSNAFKDLGDKIGPALSSIGSTVSAVSSGSPVAGALAGAGLGWSAGQGVSTVSGWTGNGAAAAGPIGAAVGAAIGAAAAHIISTKQEMLDKYIYKISLQLTEITTSFSSGAIGLAQTIQQTTQLRDQVQASLNSGSKKKRSTYRQELEGINQQLQSLQAQQFSMMNTMYEQGATAATGVDMSGFINQLDQIIQQYSQFAAAARNATDLAAANNFLVQSLQNYAQTQLGAMTQAETQAIQDALTLNDLYYQRQVLLQNEVDQEYQIMSSGILTRQMTPAQSKMEQIALMKQQDQRQLEQMNEQIAAAQYRVNAESQIFSLATTRVGLETQLLQLQNNQTLLDMARISALQQVVEAMQSGNFASIVSAGLNQWTSDPGFTAFQNLLAAMGITTPGVVGSGNAFVNAGQGIPVNVPQSGLNLEDMFLQLFNSRSSYGQGGFSIVGGGG